MKRVSLHHNQLLKHPLSYGTIYTLLTPAIPHPLSGIGHTDNRVTKSMSDQKERDQYRSDQYSSNAATAAYVEHIKEARDGNEEEALRKYLIFYNLASTAEFKPLTASVRPDTMKNFFEGIFHGRMLDYNYYQLEFLIAEWILRKKETIKNENKNDISALKRQYAVLNHALDIYFGYCQNYSIFGDTIPQERLNWLRLQVVIKIHLEQQPNSFDDWRIGFPPLGNATGWGLRTFSENEILELEPHSLPDLFDIISYKRVYLPRANLEEINLRHIQLEEAILIKANLSRTEAVSLNLKRANLSNSDFSRAKLSNAQMQEANLNQANLTYADLEEAKLNNASLVGVKLENTHMKKADFSNATLTDAQITASSLEEASFRKAYLQNASISRTNLRKTNFESASLQESEINDSDFKGAHLQKADLRNAKLNLVDFRGANLLGADLVGVEMKEMKFGEYPHKSGQFTTISENQYLQFFLDYDRKFFNIVPVNEMPLPNELASISSSL